MQPIRPERGLRPVPLRQWLYVMPGVLLGLGLGILALVAVFRPSMLVNLNGHVTLGRITVGIIGVALTALAVLGLAALLTKGGRQPQLVSDPEGLALWCGQGSAEIPWSDVLAVGVGYKITPRVAALRVPEGHVLEVFCRSSDLRGNYPRATHLIVDEPPPAPGLPGQRIRMTLLMPGVEEYVAGQLPAQVRFLGRYQRQWHALPGA